MSYKAILTGGEGEIEVKKSRFIATTHPVSSEREALDFLASVKKKYWDARHNCYAFTAGSRFELQRSSDDGEPAGTAGRPILELLLQEEIHNCIIVVTRYFGGTLLGTGGLIRAYRDAAKEGLAGSVIIDRRSGRKYTVQADYGSIGRLMQLASDEHIPILDTRYTDTVETDVVVPDELTDDFLKKVTAATSGAARVTPGEALEYAEAGGDVILYKNNGGQDHVRI